MVNYWNFPMESLEFQWKVCNFADILERQVIELMSGEDIDILVAAGLIYLIVRAFGRKK